MQKLNRQTRDDIVKKVLAFWAVAKGKIPRWPLDFSSEPLEQNPEFQEALKFKNDFTPKPDTDYEWVCEYAEKTYKMLVEAFNYVDDKADSLIKNIGAGAGIFAVGSVLSLSKENGLIALMLLPSLVSALVSLHFALSVRYPRQVTMPPTIEGAIKYAEDSRYPSQGAFLGQWHATCEGAAIAVQEKSEKLKNASKWYFWALCLLAIPIVGGALLKLCS